MIDQLMIDVSLLNSMKRIKKNKKHHPKQKKAKYFETLLYMNEHTNGLNLKIIDCEQQFLSTSKLIIVNDKIREKLGPKAIVKKKHKKHKLISDFLIHKKPQKWIVVEVISDSGMKKTLNESVVSKSLLEMLKAKIGSSIIVKNIAHLIKRLSYHQEIARHPSDLPMCCSMSGIVLMWGGQDWTFFPGGVLAIVLAIDSENSGIGFSSIFFYNVWGMREKNVELPDRICKVMRESFVITTNAWIASGTLALPGSGVRLNENLAKSLNAKIGSIIFIKNAYYYASSTTNNLENQFYILDSKE